MHATCPDHLILFNLINLLPNVHVTKSTNYKAPHYVISSILLLFLLS